MSGPKVNPINIIPRQVQHELELIDGTCVKWIYSHSHGSQNTITKWIPHDWNLRVPNIEACTASHTQRSPGTCSARNRQMYTLGLLQRKLDDLPSFHDDFMLRPAPLHEATLNEANCQSLVLVFEHNRSFQDWSSKGICDTCTHPWQN